MLDFKCCIICQETNDEGLVEKSSCHKKLLDAIEERSRYGNIIMRELWSSLKEIPPDDLIDTLKWHRTCYQDTTHSGMLKRAREKYERGLAAPSKLQKRSNSNQEEGYNGSLTRSKTMPYDRDVCFFCDGKANHQQPLHLASTDSAGESLQAAIKKADDQRLLVKLSTSVDGKDAHAIDIKYHKNCWAKHVTGVLRKRSVFSTEEHASVIAARIEFIAATEAALRSGNILTMAELEDAYENISLENNVQSTALSRKSIKQLLQSEIDDVEFHKAKRVNMSERVSVKQQRDNAILMSETLNSNPDDNMKTLYSASSILRKAINNHKKWVFNGTLDTLTGEHCPEELYSFFRWIVQGPNEISEADTDKYYEVHKRAMSLTQSTISMCMTDRQVKNTKSEVINNTREMPQQLAVGLGIHQSLRSKQAVNLLHGFGMSVDYNRLLRVETQIEKSVVQRLQNNEGIYLPPNIVMGRHAFFAVDNSDFSEDTVDGKRTLHGAALTIFQQKDEKDEETDLKLEDCANDVSLKEVAKSFSTLLPCSDPPVQPSSPKYSTFGLLAEHEIPINISLDDFAWLLSGVLVNKKSTDDAQEQQSKDETQQVPVWAGYNSFLVEETLPVSRVGTPPLLPHPVHEWSTLYTILMQAQSISTKVVGPDRKTVISLDLGLYLPAKKLQMSRKDLKHLILRPGELHVVMAMLRTIGAYIDNSGIDMCWTEADLYGPSTVKQILEGNHVKRGERAHLLTLQSLFKLYFEAFEKQEQTVCQNLHQLSENVKESSKTVTKASIIDAHTSVVSHITSTEMLKKMAKFDVSKKTNPLFHFFRHYMRMVMEMLLFIRSVRTGDWKLHLMSLEIFTKYFFAHDRLNYARMIPLYLAEMAALEETAPEIYQEFLNGNWVVNKNNNVPFCAIGADHALEHVNRSMKVSGGIVGITLNEAARTRFFLIAPEMARLAEEAKLMADLSREAPKRHHELSVTVAARDNQKVQKLAETIQNFTNPFSDESSSGCDDLYNLVTKVVMSKEIKDDLCQQSEIGRTLFIKFVEERIVSDKVNLWSRMMKQKLLTWKDSSKVVKVKTKDGTVEMKEDRNLFACLMMVCQSQRDVDIKDAVSTYEFSVVPRSLFAADGSLLHCSTKSDLLHILEKLPKQKEVENEVRPTPSYKVAVIDGMAELQSLDKPQQIRNCQQLSDHFNRRVFNKYNEYDEIHLVFDRYDVTTSLKAATRAIRQGKQDPIYYRISDSTVIHKVPMKKLLSHNSTKKELAEYLAKKVIEHGEQSGRNVVVAWASTCQATHKDVSSLQSNHEEADTKIILHAVDASSNGATQVNIHSPDTDVLVLAIRRYHEMCSNVAFVTGKGSNLRHIKLQPIVEELGPLKTAALPAFHAISGAYITGRFAGKGKVKSWKAFVEADNETTSMLSNLGSGAQPSAEVEACIEKLVCQMYMPKTQITTVKELRWFLFKRKQAQSERLPPTQAALHQAILRAHYQLIVWNNDIVANPDLPSPDMYGWIMVNKEWNPVMTPLPPAPEAVIQLVKCKCAKDHCSSNRCQCRKSGLCCTDLCYCSEDVCTNHQDDTTDILEEDSDLEE